MKLIRIAIIALPAVAGLSQTAKPRARFEVASVKESPDSPYQDDVPQRSGNRITMRNANLNTMIAWAYRLVNPNYEIVRGPYEKVSWDSYDIAAVTHDPASDDELRLMFQSLLEDRFAFKAHRETRQMTAYDLVVAKDGPRLTKAPVREMKNSVANGGISSWIQHLDSSTRQLTGRGASMDELAIVLTTRMRAPVVNRTGILGEFDYKVPFSEGTDASEAPALTTAIHELGLTLEKITGSFEVLVIDHAAKPTAN